MNLKIVEKIKPFITEFNEGDKFDIISTEKPKEIVTIVEKRKPFITEVSKGEKVTIISTEKTKEVTAFMYELGFDSQLKVKKPLGDISKVLYSYAYQNGLFNEVENVQAV